MGTEPFDLVTHSPDDVDVTRSESTIVVSTPGDDPLILNPHGALAIAYRLQMAVFDAQQSELDAIGGQP